MDRPAETRPRVESTDFWCIDVSRLAAAMDNSDTNQLVGSEELLIEEVRKRPFMYDRTLMLYKNIKQRDKTWQEIAEVLQVDPEQAKRRWRSLRDSFIKIYRGKSILLHTKSIKWIYYQQMSFLIPHLDFRRLALPQETGTTRKLKAEPQLEEYETSKIEESLEIEFDDSQFLDDDASTSSIPQKSCDDPLSVSKESDSDHQFLLSLLPTLKRLPPKENSLARIKIQQILFDVEFGDRRLS